MKKTILLAAMAVFGLASNAQTAGSVTMGASYGNQVYYKFATNSSESYANGIWDVAFYRLNAMSMAIRANEAKGIVTYEVGATSTWATVDVSQVNSWTPRYNSELVWAEGSFDNGSATYGWGEYNAVTHHVSGSRVFALKYADGTFKKIKIDDYFGGYTFTYSSWNATSSTWSADVTTTVANAASTDRFFNYYNLNTAALVTAEPVNTGWDILFTKYNADYFGDGSIMYPVTGVLHHPNVQVAENSEPGGMPTNPALTYSANINTIGYDWKTFTGSTYTISDKAFYVKLADGTVYRLKFNTFEGSSTGVITFNQQDVTALLATEQFENKVSFGVYPNPSVDKKINVLYDSANANAKNSVSVFSMTGAKVYGSTLDNNGFTSAELNLSNLNSGVYILKFESGDYSATRKIVLQ